MLEMLKERKAALEARGKKGFTLMEMLIVIAIIAVLVAIAIPVLGAQLEKARDSASVANLRNAYAEASVKYLENSSSNEIAITGVKIESAQANTWSDQAKDLPFEAPTDPGVAGDYNITFVFDTSGNVTIKSGSFVKA